MTKFYTFYDRPKSPNAVLDYETKFVSQAEADMNGLKYQIERYGMDSLVQRFEEMKSKFGYADTRVVPGFAELQNRIVAGREYFEALPSEIRKIFGHRPENYFSYLEENPEKAVQQGYISEEQCKVLMEKYNIPVANISSDTITENVKAVETVDNTENNEVSA